jgi:hypothetical protein
MLGIKLVESGDFAEYRRGGVLASKLRVEDYEMRQNWAHM